MARERDLPKKYKIPGWRYRELKYFCFGYLAKKTIAENDRDSIEAKEIEIIESAVMKACSSEPTLYEAILKQITEGLSYSELQPYVSQATFYRIRNKCFSYLDTDQRELYKKLITKGQNKVL